MAEIPEVERERMLREIWLKRRMVLGQGSGTSPAQPLVAVVREIEEIRRLEKEYEQRFGRRLGFVL